MDNTRITRYVDAAKAAIKVGSFRSKAAQKDATDCLSRAYDLVRRDMYGRDLYAGDAVDIPLDLYQVREAKHEPVFGPYWPTVAELVSLRAKIKEMPVVKAETKVDRKREIVARRIQDNPSIVALFRGPIREELTAQITEFYNRTADALLEKFGAENPKGALDAMLKETESRERRSELRALYASYLDLISDGARNAARIAHLAAMDAEAESEAQLGKMLLKLGRTVVDEAKIRAGGELMVWGNLDGLDISIEQRRILNWSALGKPYHQWPSRIYVKGVFWTEAAFAKIAD